MAEQRGDREPVREPADHRRLGRGLDVAPHPLAVADPMAERIDDRGDHEQTGGEALHAPQPVDAGLVDRTEGGRRDGRHPDGHRSPATAAANRSAAPSAWPRNNDGSVSSSSTRRGPSSVGRRSTRAYSRRPNRRSRYAITWSATARSAAVASAGVIRSSTYNSLPSMGCAV